MLSVNVGSWPPDRPEREVIRLRVLCVPAAGGGASAFRGWGNSQPPGVDIRVVQLPGLGDRILEAFPEHILALAQALCEPLLPSLDVPYVLVGNGVGALVAFELARMFQQRYFLPPIRLVAAAARPPARPPGPPLACPVTAVFGAGDTDTCCLDLVGWSAFTVGGLHCMELPDMELPGMELPGDHFALLGCRDQVLGPVYAEAALVQPAGPRSRIGPDPVPVTEPAALIC